MKISYALFVFAMLQLCTVSRAHSPTSLRKLQNDDGVQGNFFFGFFESFFNTLDGFFCSWFGWLGAGSCICSEGRLLSFLEGNQNEAKICKGFSIGLSKEITFTRAFNLDCVQEFGAFGEVTSPACSLTGGGANRIFSGAPAGVNVKNIELKDGKADKGGIALISGGTITFQNCLFEGGDASADGGALYITGGGTSVTTSVGTIFKGNKASNGGAVYLEASASGSFTDTRFVSNSVTGSGGALAAINSDVGLTGASFAGNTAAADGNDIRINDDEDPNANGSFVDCVVSATSGAVKFCQANGISEVGDGLLGAQNNDNTDCDSEGESGSPTDPKCSTN